MFYDIAIPGFKHPKNLNYFISLPPDGLAIPLPIANPAVTAK